MPSFTKSKRGSLTSSFVRTPPEKPKANTLPAMTFFVTVTTTSAWYSRSTPSIMTFSLLAIPRRSASYGFIQRVRSPVKRVVAAKMLRPEEDVQFLPETSTNSLLWGFGAV